MVRRLTGSHMLTKPIRTSAATWAKKFASRFWRSFVGWNGQCSLRTWVYRVAHNAATSHVNRQRRAKAQKLVSLEQLEHLPDRSVDGSAADTRQALERSVQQQTALGVR